jgi:hypothetical protein
MRERDERKRKKKRGGRGIVAVTWGRRPKCSPIQIFKLREVRNQEEPRRKIGKSFEKRIERIKRLPS